MVPDDMQNHARLPLHEGGMLAGGRHESGIFWAVAGDGCNGVAAKFSL